MQVFVALMLLIVGCSTPSHKAPKAKPEPSPSVCKYAAVELIEDEEGPYPKSYQCMEGHVESMSDNGTLKQSKIDCDHGPITTFDPYGLLFKRFDGTKCPSEGVIAVCVASTFKINLYRSPVLSNDIEHFSRYCTKGWSGTETLVL